ncbi:MAG: gamma-glutamylcyclotransferase [Arthrospira sp. SH-MAG29]|nr:gamma-glutamylcyclotransferase family protein [Arthrospira sp. SH-MAG29]MBS0017520.1 gamma-glutamylcyclotransferase [Arthrospira sp. SH-MAG29]
MKPTVTQNDRINDLIDVFVYGSLKPGEFNYNRFCLGRTIEELPACALGELYSLSLGYPAMTTGTGWVSGVILSFTDPSLLADLDRLEDYQSDRPPEQNQYQRRRILTYTPDQKPLRETWAYFMYPQVVSSFQGVLIPTGHWKPSYN